MKITRVFVSILLGSVIFASCETDKIFDRYYDFAASVWHVDSIPVFSFQVEDITLPYQVKYNLRHSVDYPFRNLYLTYYLEDDAGNLIASDLQEIQIFDAKSGKPLGKGMGDIFDVSVTGLESLQFEGKGTYHLKLKQFMRRDELPFLMSLGVTVKKVVPKD